MSQQATARRFSFWHECSEFSTQHNMLRVLMNACSRGCHPNNGGVNHAGVYHPVTLTMQVLSLSEMEKINYSELELPLPDLLSPSEILQEEHIKELYTLLPARAVGFPWTRIYSTSTDGFLLKTLYRKMTDFDCPVILIMQDTENAVSVRPNTSSFRSSGSGHRRDWTVRGPWQMLRVGPICQFWRVG
ncbi:hypothetical protein AVEN_173226-1 [Araneus ventricosus]|uniref:Oxidation resistance protein 1 n=1 Tax=Araneus ventricosus TaxID=182803 RepID=A0A4Y2V272_ARAVE|nr:hypothetical protein AVEN_120016-1 [Araneus ventricosus]GBO18718.1 hypothetical protein AVEN_173226-1 [Araneus ventricosus]